MASLTSGNEFYDDGYCEEELNAHDTSNKQLQIPFFGRTEELKALRKAYRSSRTKQRTQRQSSTIPAVFLWGPSGTGKSQLVQQFIQEAEEERRYFIQGKHDEHNAGDPFAAILQALDDFCQQVVAATDSNSNTEQERICKSIQTALSEEAIQALIKFVPSIQKIIKPAQRNGDVSTCETSIGNSAGSDSHSASDDSVKRSMSSSTKSLLLQQAVSSAVDHPSTGSTSNVRADTAWNRLQYTFVSFIKAITSKKIPIVLFLDDLQWSSQVSIDLLTTLLLDKDLHNFMFIGAVRQHVGDDSVDPDLPVNAMVQALKEYCTVTETNETSVGRKKKSAPWTDIHLGNLAKQSLHQFVAQLLEHPTNDDGLKSFTSKIYEKTGGNIFFAVHLLQQLERNNAIAYSRITFRWEWYWPDHQQYDHPTDNILQLMTMKLKEQVSSSELRTALILASYIRFTFDLNILRAVLENESCHGHDRVEGFAFLEDTTSCQALADLLEQAVLEGVLLNTIGDSTYRFAHDQIQQAAHDMVPFGEVRDKLRQRMGHCLLELATRQTDASDSGLIFVAADHINSSPSKDHLFSAKLNMRVGETASKMAAMAQAATYLRIAANSMRKVRNPWDEHFDLFLQLYRLRADVELSLNHYEIGFELSQEFLKRAPSLTDRLHMYISTSTALGRQDKTEESLKMLMEGAQLLGVYPKRAFAGHIMKELVSLKLYFRRHADEKILTLPMMSNSRSTLAMNLLMQIAWRGMISQNLIHYVLASFKAIRCTLKDGIHEYSALEFASYGLLSSISGDHIAAVRFANLAKEIIARTRSRSSSTALVHMICCGCIGGWSEPADQIMANYRIGHSTAMEAGDFETAFSCWTSCNIYIGWEGCSLSELALSYQSLLDQMTLYKVNTHIGMIKEHAQLVSIMSKGLPPSSHSFDWDEIKSYGQLVADENNDALALLSGNWIRLHMSVYFGKWKVAEYFAKILNKLAEKEPAYQAVSTQQYYNGLMAAGRYRQTGKRKYLRQLRQARQKSKTMCMARGNASLNRTLLLRAELQSLKKSNQDWNDVKNLYDTAIDVAVSVNHIHEAGLSCEMAGEYLLRYGHDELANKYLTKSWDFYRQWGALAKMEDLTHRRGDHVNPELLPNIQIGLLPQGSTGPAYTLIHGGLDLKMTKSVASVTDHNSMESQSDIQSVLTDCF